MLGATVDRAPRRDRRGSHPARSRCSDARPPTPAGMGRRRDAPPRLAHDRRGRPLDQHVQRRPLDRRGRRADRGRVHDRRPRRRARRYSSRSAEAIAGATVHSRRRRAPRLRAARVRRRRSSRACLDVADRVATVGRLRRRLPPRTSAHQRGRSRRAHARGHPAAHHRSQRVGIARTRSRCARRSRTSSTMHDPVVHERRARAASVGERLEPAHDRAGHQHDDDRGADERRVQLLTGVELAELARSGDAARDHHRRSSRVQRLSRPRSARNCRPRAGTRRRAARDRQQQPGVDVDRLHERAGARRASESGPTYRRHAGEQQDEEQRRGRTSARRARRDRSAASCGRCSS